MVTSNSDRDVILSSAIAIAWANKCIYCIGKAMDNPWSDAEWKQWPYQDKPPKYMLENTIRYVLPRGEVTKLSQEMGYVD